MNKKISNCKIFLLIVFMLMKTHEVFSQQVIKTAELKIGHEEKAIFEQVRMVTLGKQSPLLLKDGSYIIENGRQKANFILKNKLINGTASAYEADSTRTDYIIANSSVSSFKTYKKDILIFDVYKDKIAAYFKAFNPDHTIKSEGWVSLDKNKHYGRGITKSYYENGKLEKIADYVTETYTDFYENGKKKAVSSPQVQESYNESGKPLNKQYRKNNIRYVDDYYDGILLSRSYEGSDKSEVKEHYNNGVFEKKDVLKIVKGEKRLLTYNKAGKLISNELYSPAGEIR